MIKILIICLSLLSSMTHGSSDQCGKKCTITLVKRLIARSPYLKGPRGQKGDQGPQGSTLTGQPCTKSQGTCRIFLTASRVVGNMDLNNNASTNPYHLNIKDDGIFGANEICQGEGDARFNSGIIWHAWVSIPGLTALNNVQYSADKNFVNRSGTLIAAPGELLQTEGNGLTNPIGITQLDVWTGTRADGTTHENTCNGWTNTSADGRQGQANATAQNFTTDSNGSCHLAHRLYCFETGLKSLKR